MLAGENISCFLAIFSIITAAVIWSYLWPQHQYLLFTNIPKYPEIAAHIKEAVDQVYNGTKEPEQALDEAADNSAKALGWK